MPLVFSPRIDYGEDGSPVYYILPIVQEIGKDERKDFYRAKVPLRDGEITGGVSRGALNLTIRGIIFKSTWAGAENELDSLRTAVNGNANGKFRFFKYYDVASQTYRYHKDCIGRLSSSETYPAPIIPYSIRIRVADPTLYTIL